MSIDQFIDKYGLWVGGGLYVFIKDVLPFILNKFIPARMKALEVQRVERVKELFDERTWQHNLDTQRLEVLNEISKSTQTLSIAMAQVSTIIATLATGQDRMLNKQDTHHNSMMEAISDMKEKVAAMPPQRAKAAK